MADLGGFFSGLGSQVVRQVTGAVGSSVTHGVQKTTNDAIKDAGNAIKGPSITEQFQDKAKISAAVSSLPATFDPRKSPEMTKAVEILLNANGVGGRPDGKLDGADLQAFNKFQVQQGNKNSPDWESVRKQDVAALIEAAAAKKSPALETAIPALNKGVKEMTEANGSTPAPVSAPASAPAAAASGIVGWLKKQQESAKPVPDQFSP
ncbi:MAG: hypothetical protein AAB276_02335 [Pseudomonadota bacterium]